MISFLDRDGHTVKLSNDEVAASLKKMGNPSGHYTLVPSRWLTQHGIKDAVIQFRAAKVPHYKFWQIWYKKFEWWLKQRRIRQTFDEINDKGLIWKPTPFVLECPWLKLKGKKAITIYVD